MSFDKSCDEGIELGDMSSHAAALEAAIKSFDQIALTAAAKTWVKSDEGMQDVAVAKEAFQGVIDKAIVKRLKPGADPEKSAQLIRITMSMCVEGFIAALVAHQPADLQHQLALAIPKWINNCDTESLARKQGRFDAMLEASSIGADQKEKLVMLCQTNITAESEREAKEQAAADSGLRREYAHVGGFLPAAMGGGGRGLSASTLTGKTP